MEMRSTIRQWHMNEAIYVCALLCVGSSSPFCVWMCGDTHSYRKCTQQDVFCGQSAHIREYIQNGRIFFYSGLTICKCRYRSAWLKLKNSKKSFHVANMYVERIDLCTIVFFLSSVLVFLFAELSSELQNSTEINNTRKSMTLKRNFQYIISNIRQHKFFAQTLASLSIA